jgi:hypothetical protein
VLHSSTKQIIVLSIAFIAFTIIGTISHELGHIAVAKYLGYNTVLHYGSMTYESANGEEIPLIDDILILIGGPLQTFLTAILGIYYLAGRRSIIKNEGMYWKDWLALFLGLFLLRELFNYLMNFTEVHLLQTKDHFTGDEAILSEVVLGQNASILPLINAMVSILGLSWLIFILLPKKYRFNLILSGILGGGLGFVIWMKLIGPLVLS